MTSGLTDYGFRWGPILVERLIHVEGKGYSLEVRTDAGQLVQIGVSEHGRKVRVFGPLKIERGPRPSPDAPAAVTRFRREIVRDQ